MCVDVCVAVCVNVCRCLCEYCTNCLVSLYSLGKLALISSLSSSLSSPLDPPPRHRVCGLNVKPAVWRHPSLLPPLLSFTLPLTILTERLSERGREIPSIHHKIPHNTPGSIGQQYTPKSLTTQLSQAQPIQAQNTEHSCGNICRLNRVEEEMGG